ncbi:hypothetical protein GF338_04250 [candidate division WOR-3 bacterium]|nr:hypothetical protein [candidate division WOR-3 bacterium]
MDWTDPNGRYSIPAAEWSLPGSNPPVLDDIWQFWVFEPLRGMEPIQGEHTRVEAIDLKSQHEHGKAVYTIDKNRFITLKDADAVARRILKLFKDPKRILILTIPIDTDVPTIGDRVFFESEQASITKTTGWRVIGVSKKYSANQASIDLRVEEIL